MTWDMVRLEEVIESAQPGFASGENVESGVIQIRMNNVDTQGRLSFETIRRVPATKKELKKCSLVVGDVLFNNTNSPELVGKCCVFNGHDEPVVFSNHFTRLKPQSNKLDSKFLAHFLVAKWQQGLFTHICKRWVNQAAVQKERLFEVEIPLPPLPEQKRIAAILDKADAIRRKRKATLDMADEFLRATFLDMFGDPLTNPKEWKVKRLEEVVKKGTSITYGIVQAGPHVENGIPYIKTGDMVNGQIKTVGLSKTSHEIVKKFKRSEVNYGDLVFSIRASVGAVAELPLELDGANLTQGTAKLSPGDQILKKFLLHCLRTKGFQTLITQRCKGATFKEITLKSLREMPVIIPPMQLQNKFELMANAFEKMNTTTSAAFSMADDLFASLSQRAFRGEL